MVYQLPDHIIHLVVTIAILLLRKPFRLLTAGIHGTADSLLWATPKTSTKVLGLYWQLNTNAQPGQSALQSVMLPKSLMH